MSHSFIFQSLKPAKKRTLCFPRSVSERLLFTYRRAGLPTTSLCGTVKNRFSPPPIISLM